ncbi:hypothetical protein [Paenibacillus sp. LK1]|uniref:hypothetical protein n=1 Tax=Paenibacillus sp. LK1 TaxID=2053014 RepID=UPI000C1A46F1|nr:hypothetical protein [Paenibacillus sp. LK1]PIH56946.1 hypothetical protein CS562_22635 [Paenibacillus sp. LK1]
MAISTVTAIPIMTSNTAPSGIASASSADASFPAYLAFNGVFNATGWRGLGATNQWLRYEFPTSKAIAKYSIATWTPTRSVKSWTFEGSNDGTIWEVLDTRINITTWVAGVKQEFIVDSSKVKSYKMYRINCSVNNGDASYTDISELEMFEWLYSNKFLISSEDKIYSVKTKTTDTIMTPIMTSNILPSGIVSASSVQSSSYEAWRAFDRTITIESTWRSAINTTSNSWLRYEFPSPQVINKYILRCWKQLAQSPSSWTFQGSNNAQTWTILDTKSSISGWDVNDSLSVDITNNTPYKFYQIVFTAAVSGLYYIITDFELINSVKYSILEINENSNEELFLSKGMDKSIVVDLNENFEKTSFSTKEIAPMGTGRVFRKSIDTTKIPIKKASIT